MIDEKGVDARLTLFRELLDRLVSVGAAVSAIDSNLTRYDKRQPSRRALAAAFVVLAAAFVCGVVLPMLDPSTSHIVDADVPVAAYLLVVLTAFEISLRYSTSQPRA
jgi:hypothetical protein